MASRSTPKRMQSIESIRESQHFLIRIRFFTAGAAHSFGLTRDSLSLYKVFHNSQVQLEGSGSLSSCFVSLQNYGGLTRPFVHLVVKS